MPERLYGVVFDYNDVPEMRSAKILRETAKLYHIDENDARNAGDIFGWRKQIHKEDKEAQITTPEEAIKVARERLEEGVRECQRKAERAVKKLNGFEDWVYKNYEEGTKDVSEDS